MGTLAPPILSHCPGVSMALGLGATCQEFQHRAQPLHRIKVDVPSAGQYNPPECKVAP